LQNVLFPSQTQPATGQANLFQWFQNIFAPQTFATGTGGRPACDPTCTTTAQSQGCSGSGGVICSWGYYYCGKTNGCYSGGSQAWCKSDCGISTTVPPSAPTCNPNCGYTGNCKGSGGASCGFGQYYCAATNQCYGSASTCLSACGISSTTCICQSGRCTNACTGGKAGSSCSSNSQCFVSPTTTSTPSADVCKGRPDNTQVGGAGPTCTGTYRCCGEKCVYTGNLPCYATTTTTQPQCEFTDRRNCDVECQANSRTCQYVSTNCFRCSGTTTTPGTCPSDKPYPDWNVKNGQCLPSCGRGGGPTAQCVGTTTCPSGFTPVSSYDCNPTDGKNCCVPTTTTTTTSGQGAQCASRGGNCRTVCSSGETDVGGVDCTQPQEGQRTCCIPQSTLCDNFCRTVAPPQGCNAIGGVKCSSGSYFCALTGNCYTNQNTCFSACGATTTTTTSTSTSPSKQTCSDGTSVGTCSKTKPARCYSNPYGSPYLRDDCNTCSCPSDMYCNPIKGQCSPRLNGYENCLADTSTIKKCDGDFLNSYGKGCQVFGNAGDNCPKGQCGYISFMSTTYCDGGCDSTTNTCKPKPPPQPTCSSKGGNCKTVCLNGEQDLGALGCSQGGITGGKTCCVPAGTTPTTTPPSLSPCSSLKDAVCKTVCLNGESPLQGLCPQSGIAGGKMCCSINQQTLPPIQLPKCQSGSDVAEVGSCLSGKPPKYCVNVGHSIFTDYCNKCGCPPNWNCDPWLGSCSPSTGNQQFSLASYQYSVAADQSLTFIVPLGNANILSQSLVVSNSPYTNYDVNIGGSVRVITFVWNPDFNVLVNTYYVNPS